MNDIIKRIESLANVTDIACQPGNYDCDPYMYGMANGLILAKSIIDGTNPDYLTKPERWRFDDKNLEEIASSPSHVQDDQMISSALKKALSGDATD